MNNWKGKVEEPTYPVSVATSWSARFKSLKYVMERKSPPSRAVRQEYSGSTGAGVGGVGRGVVSASGATEVGIVVKRVALQSVLEVVEWRTRRV